ncbi:unnamed protein product [Pylaiella littoralis]
MEETAQQPQFGHPAEAVDVSYQKPAGAVQQETVGFICSSGQEREPDVLLSPVKPSQFHMSENKAITGGPETPESDSGRNGEHNDSRAAPTLTLQDTDHKGDIGSGSGNHASVPRNSDVEIDGLFDGLKIESGGDLVKAKNEKQESEGRETLRASTQGLKNRVELESFKRLDAESRTETLEVEVQVLADRWSSEIAAREAAEANAKRYMDLFTEARAAWQHTQGIVENKEKELIAAEHKINRKTGDWGSMQSRLEEAKKTKELHRQHSLVLKQALEGSLSKESTFSPISSAETIVALPSPENEDKALPENIDACGSGGKAKSPSAPSSKVAAGPEAGGIRYVPSSQPKLEEEREAAAEARLQMAITIAAARSKTVTATSLVQKKAQLKHVQQQGPMQQGNYAWPSSPRRQRAPTSKGTPLSPMTVSCVPPTTTSTALQHHAHQQHARRQQDGNQARLCRELEKPVPAAQKGDDAQLPLDDPYTPGTTPTAFTSFPQPLPCRSRSVSATKQPEVGEGNGRSNNGGNNVGFASGYAGSRSRVTMRVPQLPQSFSGPSEEGNQKERAEQSKGHQQGKPTILDALDDMCVSDETHHGLDAHSSATNHSNKSGFGEETKAISGGIYGNGRIDGSNGCDEGHTEDNIENPRKACGVTTPISGDDGSLAAMETAKYSGQSGAYGDSDERGVGIVKRVGAFLETLESATCRKTMVTLEVGMGSAVQVMNERKFLDLHDTKEGIGELLVALGATASAF